MILGIQLLGVIFGLFMLYLTFLHFKRKEFTINETGFWSVVWIVFLIVTLIPRILDPILESLNIARTMDFFIILGFMFLIFTNFYTYGVVRKTQKKVERVVREVAIKRAK